MTVRASGTATIPGPGYDVSFFNRKFVGWEDDVRGERFVVVLVFLHPGGCGWHKSIQMSVHRSETIGVVYVNCFSISPGTFAQSGNISVSGCMHRVSRCLSGFKVQAGVKMVASKFSKGA